MRAGQEARSLRVAAVINADNIADGVDGHLVKAAVVRHPVNQLPGTGAVRRGQVGHRELAALGIARVAVAAELLGPVPDLVAKLRRAVELVVQADFRDAVNIAQAFGPLEVGRIAQAPGECRDDLRLEQARPTRAAHRQDEGKAEFCLVVGIELVKPRQFVKRAIDQACFGLLVRGLGGQAFTRQRPAGQFGVGAYQGKLHIGQGAANRQRQRLLELRQAGKRPLAPSLDRNPGRMLVNAIK